MGLSYHHMMCVKELELNRVTLKPEANEVESFKCM